MIAALAIVFGSIAVLQLEQSAGGNITTGAGALWWAIVTVTTVGYGDAYPVTQEGRLVAVGLMTVGIGLYGTFTAFIAHWFLKPGEKSQDEELAAIRKQLSEVQSALSKIEGRGGA